MAHTNRMSYKKTKITLTEPPAADFLRVTAACLSPLCVWSDFTEFKRGFVSFYPSLYTEWTDFGKPKR